MMTSFGTSWSEADQAVLTTLHRLVRQHDEAAYSSSCSRTEAAHAYNSEDQQGCQTAFTLLTFPSSSNGPTTEVPSSSCQRRQVTHAQIDTVLSDLRNLTDSGFVWIDLVDLSSLPILARHYDIHDACLRGRDNTARTCSTLSLLDMALPLTPHLPIPNINPNPDPNSDPYCSCL